MRIDKVQIWVDAEMTFESALPREVTDCEGNILELGDFDIPSLGEMTFAPNALSQQQMLEIMFAGFSLQDIAVGKQPYTSKAQLSDTILTRTDKELRRLRVSALALQSTSWWRAPLRDTNLH